VTDKPSLIKLRTTIGFGSNQEGTHSVHGSALKADDITQIKKKFGFDAEKTFVIPQEVTDLYHKRSAEGAAKEQEWKQVLEKYSQSQTPPDWSTPGRLGEDPANILSI
jgi:transketolase